MQDYILDLSNKNLYTAYVSARRKRFLPEDCDTVIDRMVVKMRTDAPVVDILPDLYLLAAVSDSFEEFLVRFEAFKRRLE